MDRAALQQYLQDKYAQDLEAAKYERDIKRSDAGFQGALDKLIMTATGAPGNQDFYADRAEKAGQGVADVTDARNQAVASYRMGQEFTKDAGAEADRAYALGKRTEDDAYTQEKRSNEKTDRSRMLQDIQDRRNPASQLAESYRQALQTYPGMESVDLSGRSVEEMEKLFPLYKDRLDSIKTQATKKPSDAQTKEIGDLRLAISEVDQLLAFKDKYKIDTGPINAQVQRGLKVAGRNDKNYEIFRNRINKQLADYIRSLSGAATTEGERKFLADQMPTDSDNDEQLVAKLQDVKRYAQGRLSERMAGMEAQGKDTSGFTKGIYNPPLAPLVTAPGKAPGKVVTAPSQDPQEAVKWLEANPNDPDAPAVREKLKAMGIK